MRACPSRPPAAPPCTDSATAGPAGARQLPAWTTIAGRSSASPPPVSPPLSSPRPPLPIPLLGRTLGRPECRRPWPPEPLAEGPSLPSVRSEEEDEVAVLHLTPWVSLNPIDSILCLVPFERNPLNLLSFCTQIQPTHFYRSNPEFYQFHEHCLLCLGNLFRYSLKSIVNCEHVLFILFSPYLLCFSSVLIRSSCIRFIIM
jgi:hypothetical protein